MSNLWTLLITDDCQEDREVYREYLSRDPEQSYQFIEAGSAEAGLALCQEQHYDAILLDFRLPDMTGIEFLDELQQQSNAEPLPIIMLTGQGDESIAVQAMKRGVQDYLIKQDLEPDLLQCTVRNVIQQTRLQHQRYLLADVALRLHQSLDAELILQTAATEVHRLLECDRVIIYQAIQDTHDGLGDEAGSPTLIKRYETGLSGATKHPIQKFLSFLDGNSLSEASILRAGSRRKKTYLLTPILLPGSPADSEAWGLLVACQNSDKQQWQPDEARFLKDFANQLATALQNAEQHTQTLEVMETEKQIKAVASQLVATVSHEYRTPLTAILAAASTLKARGEQLVESKQQEFLHLIEDKARLMTLLVDDLLVLETFEAGKTNFDPTPFELLQFISNLLEEQRQACSGERELTFKITGNTQGFWGDPKLLRLILMNLLSNAIKYSRKDSPIEIHLLGSADQIVIEVTDEGIGIPDEEQLQIFQSFSRGSNVDETPGSGLGLAIVKACIDLHGGEVTLISQANKGSKFTVHLPKRPSNLIFT